MPILFEINNFSERLYLQSITLVTCFGVFSYDAASHQVSETPNANNIRNDLADKKQLTPLWLAFSVGYELLFKSALSKHKALTISKKNVSGHNSQIEAISRVYSYVQEAQVSAPADEYLRSQLNTQGISNLYDFSTGGLGSCRACLNKLLERKLITSEEKDFLKDATQLLSDIRRNVDVHTFFGFTVGKSIYGDLENVYLPALNLLLQVYWRPMA